MRYWGSSIAYVLLIVLILTLTISDFGITSASSGTVVKGVLKGTVVWTPDKSPYVITGKLVIHGTLIIEPGVKVYVYNHVIIKIDGELLINGTKEKPVIIKSFNQSSTRWYFDIYRKGTLIVRNAVMDQVKWWVMDGAHVVLEDVIVNGVFEAKYSSNSYIMINNSRLGSLTLHEVKSLRVDILNSSIGTSEIRVTKCRVFMRDVRIGTLTLRATYSSIAFINTEIKELRASKVDRVLMTSNLILINCTINNVSLESSLAALWSSKVVIDNCNLGDVSIKTNGHGMDHAYFLIVNSRINEVSIDSRKYFTMHFTAYIADSIISYLSIHTGNGWGHNLGASIVSSVIGKLITTSDDNSYDEDLSISLINVTGNTLRLTTGGFLKSSITVKYSNIVNGGGLIINRVGENTLINVTYSNIFNDKPYGIYIEKGYKYETTRIYLNNNWWGDPSGPQHPKLNPGGKGCPIYVPTEGITLTKWLSKPSTPMLNYPKVVASVLGGTKVPIGKEVVFDLSKSVDPDGRIVEYIAVIPSEHNIIVISDPKIKIKFTVAGPHDVVFYIIDNDGLISRKVIKVNVIRYPLIIIYSPKEGFITNLKKIHLKLSIKYCEEVTKVYIYLNNTCIAKLAPKYSYDLILNMSKDGRYVIRVIAKTLSSEVVERNVSIIYDATPPKVYLSVKALPGNVVIINWDVKDLVSGLYKTLLTLGSRIISKKPSGTLKLRLKPGTYEVTLSTEDKAGNRAIVARKVTVGQITSSTTTATKVSKTTTTTKSTTTSTTSTKQSLTTSSVSTHKVSTASVTMSIKTTTTSTTLRTSSTTTHSLTTKTTTKTPSPKLPNTLLIGGIIVIAIITTLIALVLRRK